MQFFQQVSPAAFGGEISNKKKKDRMGYFMNENTSI